MPPDLTDLLWRDHPAVPPPSRRGPKRRTSVSAIVDAALAVADRDGLAAVVMRDVAAVLDVPPMSLYTYVGSRDDLIVLMVDAAHAAMPPSTVEGSWRYRVRAVAEANHELYRTRPWLLDAVDDRVAVGPGTIAKYDRELRAFDGTGLTDVERDAALSFVLDYVRSAADRARRTPTTAAAQEFWAHAGPRLAGYLDPSAVPLAARVGAAAGEHQQAAYSAERAFAFGLARTLDGLAALIERRA
ncbi:TetR/AcrR family transcriptional regulator [Pseudonocardia sp. CA-107938]|uniref:TetR/AcrR family transcriptional regulator n=1 Tax=Pseudonocardia sp. CA-107938 TaxID=3240021 RepID=UPI003D921106